MSAADRYWNAPLEKVEEIVGELRGAADAARRIGSDDIQHLERLVRRVADGDQGGDTLDEALSTVIAGHARALAVDAVARRLEREADLLVPRLALLRQQRAAEEAHAERMRGRRNGPDYGNINYTTDGGRR